MPQNLLLADDAKTTQQAVSMTFAREDVQLTTVEDGEQALATAKRSKPDLILADVSMPRLGGYELCQRVRADASIKDIPVLLLGGGSPVDPSKAMAVGANGHMPKPFDSGKLIDQVKQILANPKAKPAVSAPPPAAKPIAPPPPAARPPSTPPARQPAMPGAAGSTVTMARPPPVATPARPGISAPPPVSRPPAPPTARPGMPPLTRPPPAPGARPLAPPLAGSKPPPPLAKP